MAGIFLISVVAKINFTFSGGSSSVFNNALKAAFDNIWTSSIIYTLNLPSLGEYITASMISLIPSTPVLLAASTSITSRKFPLLIDIHGEHWLHISKVGSLIFPSPTQFKAFAIILAVVVLPTPLIPVKRNACANRPLFREFLKVFTSVSCPINSPKSLGLYFRANTL